MTRLYRERRRIDRPASLIARDLAGTLGPPDTEGEGTWEWRYTALGGIYRYRVVLSSERGDLSVDVGAPSPFRWVAASALLVAPAVAALGAPDPVLAAVLWGYAGVAILPVAHRLPGVPTPTPAFEGTVLVGQRLTAVAVPGYLAVLAGLWAGLGAAEAGLATVFAVGGLTVLGSGVYWVASRPLPGDPIDSDDPFGSDPSDASRRTADGRRVPGDGGATSNAPVPGVPASGIALSGLLPALVTLGNGLVAVHVVTADPRPVAAALAAVVVVALDAAFFTYCRLALESFEGAQVAQPTSVASRVVIVALAIGSNLVLVAASVVGLQFLADVATGAGGPTGHPTSSARSGASLLPVGEAVADAGSLPASLLAVLAVGAAIPLVVVALGWASHLVATVGGGGRSLFASERLSGVGIDGVEVRVADLGAPVARPAGIPGRRVVLVDRSLVDALSGSELAAVVAHERAHLDARDPATSLVVGLASLAVGGRNVVLSLSNYPAIEARADRRAADEVGVEPLVGALRTMETLRAEAGAGRSRDRSPAGLVRDTLLAPGRLLFGPVVLDRSHRSVDERIARLVAADQPSSVEPSG